MSWHSNYTYCLTIQAIAPSHNSSALYSEANRRISISYSGLRRSQMHPPSRACVAVRPYLADLLNNSQLDKAMYQSLRVTVSVSRGHVTNVVVNMIIISTCTYNIYKYIYIYIIYRRGLIHCWWHISVIPTISPPTFTPGSRSHGHCV